MAIYPICRFVLLALVISGPLGHAGILEDFEEDASQSSRPRRDPYRGRDPYEDARRKSEHQGSVIHIPLVPFNPLDRHRLGHPTKPLFRVDGAYQEAKSQVMGIDVYTQAGYERIGFDFRYTRYEERDTADKLSVYRGHVLWRSGHSWNQDDPISCRQGFYEFDYGFGVMVLEGRKTHDGPSLTFPLLFYPLTFVGVEFRPAWAYINENVIQDYDLGLHLRYSVAAFKVGYRWLKSPNISLHGPYAGVVLRF